MRVIGLTGGVGSGKSLVAQILKQETGAELILTDDVGHIVTDKGGSAFDLVVERFGNEIVSETGEIDRKKLADIVFNDKKAIKDLNDIVHPKVKEYIEQYLEKYSGIKKFMDDIVEIAKKQGYVETLFHRRRYIPEINSNNYMVRKFGERVAMNTPIQGTAADIMKIAMINVMKELKSRNMKSKIVLQVHDEMMIEAPIEEAEIVKNIVKESMESAVTLKIPLIAEVSEAENWYECK